VQSVIPLPNPGPEKPEKRDVMIDNNPEGRYDDEKMVEKQVYEKPEKRDVVTDVNSEGKYDKEEVDQDVFKTDDQTGNDDMLRMKDEHTEGTRDEGSDDENDDENEKQLNTQWVDIHNQLGMAQGTVPWTTRPQSV
jgi:hypothetical protein